MSCHMMQENDGNEIRVTLDSESEKYLRIAAHPDGHLTIGIWDCGTYQILHQELHMGYEDVGINCNGRWLNFCGKNKKMEIVDGEDYDTLLTFNFKV